MASDYTNYRGGIKMRASDGEEIVMIIKLLQGSLHINKIITDKQNADITKRMENVNPIEGTYKDILNILNEEKGE